MLSELAARFIPHPEERLLAVVHALLHRCYKYSTATSAEVPAPLRKEMAGVCRACFSQDTVNKHHEFVKEYKQQFERDLSPESDEFPPTLARMTERLKAWEQRLQGNVEERIHQNLKLHEESRLLRDWTVLEVEMPGQYFGDVVSDASSLPFH